jgi:hypothetical protein
MIEKSMRILFFLGVCLIGACNPSPADISPSETAAPRASLQSETAVLSVEPAESPTVPTAARTNTKEKTNPPEPTAAEHTDVNVKLGVVEFVIPAGLAESASLITTTSEEWPYVNPSIGPLPEHWVITLAGYALENPGFTPRIIIFHTDEYEQFSPMTQAIIQPLRELQLHPEGSVPAGVFISRFSAHVFKLPSPNGIGVRYLTQVFMNYGPITNDDIFYYYVGLSTDGGYYVSAMLSVNLSFLPKTGNPDDPLPADGVPFPGAFDSASFGDYLQAVAARINATPAEEVRPSLLLLDKMMRSIQIN